MASYWNRIKPCVIGGTDSLGWYEELGLLVLRVFAGLSMAFAHGINKVPPPDGFVELTGNLGFPLPYLFALKAGLAEFLGGILLALGLGTRPVALALCFTMFVAAFMAHGNDPFSDKELPLLFLCSYFAFLLVGSGKWSLDSLIRSRV